MQIKESHLSITPVTSTALCAEYTVQRDHDVTLFILKHKGLKDTKIKQRQ